MSETTRIPRAAPTDEAKGPTLLDIDDFNKRIVGAYNSGSAELNLEADLSTARSHVPAGTGALRDFSYIAPEIPMYDPSNCIACMECVIECPDTAILAKVVKPEALEQELAKISDPLTRDMVRSRFGKTKKYWDFYERKEAGSGGLFGIFIDPTKCKGCCECVEQCDDLALSMLTKSEQNVPQFQAAFSVFESLPDTPEEFVKPALLTDMMLAEKSMLYVGGAGSCAGCGEATALRMMLASTGFQYGRENIGIVAATGCNTVYTSTYPYNPYLVPWTNSLFENAPADAMGIRVRWNQMGWENKRLWVVGGDGAMNDIGFQSLSRMLVSGMDIKVLVLDTQVYSNTGGQASTSSYTGQNTKMSYHGRAIKGKTEARKELATICMMHPHTFVAQTTCADFNHFYKAISTANEFPGPAIINVYTTCQPEHGVGDEMASHQAKLAKESRAFPIFIYDPRAGDTIRERLDLRGNPAVKEDWYTIPKTGEVIDFITFARSEGRFAKHFDADGNPSPELLAVQEDRLRNWRMLQELAGVR
ncbi:thiamine pyrophosphate-binding protein [Candidatus Poribacteria bacterium]|nr:thiamine pyrophosphate-binding protein [Candidatus Poribacteria bacterium]